MLNLVIAEARKLTEKIKRKGGELVGATTNLVDAIWGAERPSRPNEKVMVLDIQYSGKSHQEKIDDLRKELEKKRTSGMVVCKSDFNAFSFPGVVVDMFRSQHFWMRSLGSITCAEESTQLGSQAFNNPLTFSSIPYNPVFFSYSIITPTTATLYVDDSKLGHEVRAHLGDTVRIRPYESIFGDAKALSIEPDAYLTNGTAASLPKRKFLISTKASWALSQSLGGEEKVEEARSPIEDAKAIKNKAEIEGARACQIRDGAALSEYFAWLEAQVTSGEQIDEVTAADKLEQIRR